MVRAQFGTPRAIRMSWQAQDTSAIDRIPQLHGSVKTCTEDL
jgi:hypothetical protein